MKDVNLYVLGKYDYNTREGYWAFYLEYKGAVMKRSGYLSNAISNNYASLYAVMQAINCMKEPCNIHLHSKAHLGFVRTEKASNKEMIKHIQKAIYMGGHLFEHDVKFDDELIAKWENKYGKPKESKPKVDVADQYSDEQKATASDWRAMYSDFMGPSEGCWVPGSGGY